MSTDRPDAGELATAVREFLEAEILPCSTTIGCGFARSSR